MVLKIIFGLQREHVAGGRRRLLKVGRHDLHQRHCGDKIKEDEVGWEYVTYGAEKNVIYGLRVEALWKETICKT
jgi:hypothetical protein